MSVKPIEHRFVSRQVLRAMWKKARKDRQTSGIRFKDFAAAVRDPNRWKGLAGWRLAE